MAMNTDDVSQAIGNVQITSSDETTDVQSAEKQVEKKSRPPPIDVNITRELQHLNSHESRTPTTALPYTPSFSGRKSDKEKKIGHRRVNEEGQITYKKIETTQIMGSIQLGISYAVGSLASKPDRDILMQDFTMVETTSFPNDGSNMTPAHHYSDFKFRSYSPFAFRHFRDLFGIQPDDFLLSVCNEPLRELSNPGASGSIFYLTDDDEFIIKTVQHKEAEFLQKLLPGYYMNLNQNPRTLLPKFFGLFNYQCGGKNVRLVAMNNLLPSSVKMHLKYDLKGSTYKRRANKYERSKESPTYKDLDFTEHHPEGILLEAETYTALVKTMSRDCRVLESFKIMDYSLLVGIHNLDQAAKEKAESRIKKETTEPPKTPAPAPEPDSSDKFLGGRSVNLSRSKSINRQRLAAFSTAMESIQAEAEPIDTEEDVPPGGIPARNTKGERLLLFMGVIDILQSYRLKKRLEHTWKSMLHDGDTVSVHRPSFYASRFLDFMSKTVFKKIPSPLKHSPSKRKGTSLRSRPSSVSDRESSRSAHEQGTSASSQKVADNANGNRISVVEPCMTVDSEKLGSGVANQGVDSPSLSKPISIPDHHHIAQTTTAAGRASPRSKQKSSGDPAHGLRLVQKYSKSSHSSLDKSDVVSISQVTIHTDSIGNISESSSSSTSGLGSSIVRNVTWTPPHSIEGSTPTHTEGTPSFTESSSSGDIACSTTPVKSIGSRDSSSVRDVSSPQFYFETDMSLSHDPSPSSTAPLVSRLVLPSIDEDQVFEEAKFL